MATMTVSLPETMKNWVEQRIAEGGYASASDYVRDLIRRDVDSRKEPLTTEELRAILKESAESGYSDLSVTEIFDQAVERARRMGLAIE